MMPIEGMVMTNGSAPRNSSRLSVGTATSAAAVATEEPLSWLILVGERGLRRAHMRYQTHIRRERPHHGKGTMVLMHSRDHPAACTSPIQSNRPSLVSPQ